MAGFGLKATTRKPQSRANTSSLCIASFNLNSVDYQTNFSGFCAVSVDKMAVTDAYNKRVLFFNSSGKITGTAGLGKLRGPEGICYYDNKWIVSDSGVDKQRLVVYDDEDRGKFLRQFQTQDNTEPGHIAVSPNLIAVLNMMSQSITVYDHTGQIHARISPTLSEKDKRFQEYLLYEVEAPTDYISPERCAFDSDENLYVTFGTAASMVKVYTSKGEFVRQFGNWRSATALSVTPRGNVLVVDTEERKVDVLSREGDMIKQSLLSPANGLNLYPHHISVLDGNVIALTLSNDLFSSPNIIQLFQL